MIPAKSCHYTTKFNSERHKSTKIFSIHRTLILFFPYSLYYWAFQDPPCRHRCSKGSTILPHSPIWFVIYTLWFVDTSFCISNTQHLLKITSISTLFFQNPCTIQINVVSLHHKNPPSLSTMLKSAGRFIL